MKISDKNPAHTSQTRPGTSNWLARLLLAGMLLLPVVPAVSVLAEELDMEALKAELERAREQLDEAASKLADLNMKMFKVETSGEHSSRPMLGVLISDYERSDGIKLVGVTPEGGASEAGLEAGDLLVAVNGNRLDDDDNSMHALKNAMDSVSAGDTVAVEYLRDDVLRTAEITTQARREFAMKMGRDFEIDIDVGELVDLEQLEKLEALGMLAELEALKELESLGSLAALEALGDPEVVAVLAGEGNLVSLEDVSGDLAGYFGVDEGVVVMAVPDESELKAGDVLLSLAGSDVDSAQVAAKTISKAEGDTPAKVLRNERRLDLTIAEGTVASSGPIIRTHKRSIKIHIDDDEEVAADGDDSDDD
jgi:hypothetical protein